MTHIYLPVAVFGAFAAAVIEANLALNAVRFINVSGEQLHLDSRCRALLDKLPGKRLMNLYGPTETHAVTSHVVHGGIGERAAHVPIGLPIAGVDLHLLDARGRPVPPGAVGEIFLGGVCPADGYVNDAERTAGAFLPDPYAPAGARMYRTGDLAILAEDTLIFLGRRDGQVKIRGYRVELGEIETVAEALPSVAAATAGVHGRGETAALCLFIRSAPDAAFNERAIRGALEQSLPAYMIPRHILSVDSIPLTSNGKVDRVALLASFGRGEIAHAEDTASADWVPTPTEELVSSLWAKLLGRAPAGPQDSFFAFGGTSFDVLKLIAALHDATSVRVAVSEFFRHPTVAALAAQLDKHSAANRQPALAAAN